MVSIMTWLTATEYLCHKWPRIWSTCHKHFQVLSSFMTYRRLCNWSNKTGTTSGTGTAYHFGAPEFIPGFGFKWGSCCSIFSFLCSVLLVLLSVFYWPLCFLFFLDLQILITPLVSSKSFHRHFINKYMLINVRNYLCILNLLFT